MKKELEMCFEVWINLPLLVNKNTFIDLCVMDDDLL